MQITLTIPATKEQIKEETTRLREEIKVRQTEIEMLRKAIHHYQSLCDHPGQKTGYNERDGNWANPCSICGESH